MIYYKGKFNKMVDIIIVNNAEEFSKKLEEIHYILKNIVTLKNIIYSNIYISNYEFFFHKRKHKN